MSCRHALIIFLADDGEFTHADVRQARLHAARCPRCRDAYVGGLSPLVRPGLLLREPPPAFALRAGLLLVASFQLVIAVPWLFGRSLIPDAHVAVSHLTRDGALGLVSAAVGLVTVWRPRYVYSTMLIGVLVLALQLVAGLFDQQSNSVNASFEIVHLPMVLIVLALFSVGASTARRATPFARRHSSLTIARDAGRTSE